MKIKFFFLLLLLFQSFIIPQEDSAKPSLIMKDGQIVTHPIQVFVRNTDIKPNMRPVLCLVAIDQVTREKYTGVWCKGPSFKAFEVSPGQSMAYKSGETTLTITGTMMLFDISSLHISFFKTGMRVLPIVTWISDKTTLPDGKEKRAFSRVIGEDEIYIGNGSGAVFWTLVTLVVFMILIKLLTIWGDKKFFDLIKIYDAGTGKVSLSLTQMFLWTIAIGVMVMIFSLMYLQVPEIPDSLIALMGLSVATGSIGQYQTTEIAKRTVTNAVSTLTGFKAGLSELISIDKSDGHSFPSIAKTQHLFWTVITIILFIWKSAVDGQLWEVPTALVILMGMSQTGYLIRNQMEIKNPQGQKPEEQKLRGETLKK